MTWVAENKGVDALSLYFTGEYEYIHKYMYTHIHTYRQHKYIHIYMYTYMNIYMGSRE
jgi:hypothetical protein